MDIVRKRTWNSFRGWLRDYFALDQERREQCIFRGIRFANWKLETTLDRFRDFANDDERRQFNDALLEEFKRELLYVGSEAAGLAGDALQLLARHHGLPSPLMDWSESPYVAAFFAFSGCTIKDRQRVAIWMLDRAKLITPPPSVDFIDDYSLLRFNQRALRQRGLFLRLASKTPLESLVDDALTKIEIPAKQSRLALAELDEMAINATYLFADMEGAAKTATVRVTARSS